jgi:hypothetical protein
LESGHPISLNIMAGDTNNPCANDYFIKHWFAQDINQILNLDKNTMAFQYLCHSLGIQSIILTRDQVSRPGEARDLDHPGKKSYQILAEHIKSLL